MLGGASEIRNGMLFRAATLETVIVLLIELAAVARGIENIQAGIRTTLTVSHFSYEFTVSSS